MDNGGKGPLGAHSGAPRDSKGPKWLKNASCSVPMCSSGVPTYQSFQSRVVGDVQMDNGGLRPPRAPLNDPKDLKNRQNGPNIGKTAYFSAL